MGRRLSGRAFPIFQRLTASAPVMLGCMARSRFKLFLRRLWRFTKWAVGWSLAIFGFIGLPDQLGEWEDYLAGWLAGFIRL